MSCLSHQETQSAALRYFSDVMWLVESEPRPQTSPAFSTLFSSILRHPVLFKELPADVLYAMDVRGTVYVNVAFPHASTPCKVRRNLLRLLSVLYFHKAFYCSGAKYCGTLNRLDYISLENDLNNVLTHSAAPAMQYIVKLGDRPLDVGSVLDGIPRIWEVCLAGNPGVANDLFSQNPDFRTRTRIPTEILYFRYRTFSGIEYVTNQTRGNFSRSIYDLVFFPYNTRLLSKPTLYCDLLYVDGPDTFGIWNTLSTFFLGAQIGDSISSQYTTALITAPKCSIAALVTLHEYFHDYQFPFFDSTSLIFDRLQCAQQLYPQIVVFISNALLNKLRNPSSTPVLIDCKSILSYPDFLNIFLSYPFCLLVLYDNTRNTCELTHVYEFNEGQLTQAVGDK